MAFQEKTFPGAISAGSGMRLAVTGAIDGAPRAPLLFRGDLDGIARDAAAVGYQGVEIHVPNIWEWDAEAFQNSCAAAGIAVSALVSGQLNVRMGLSFTHEDPAVADKAAEGLKRFVDAAAVHRSGVVVGWVKGLTGGKPELRARQSARFREVGEYAVAKGVPIYIEALNRYESDTLNTAAELAAYLDGEGIPGTFIHLDTYHMNIEESCPVQAIRQAGRRLGYFHVAENTRYYPGHDRYDFDRVFAALEDIGYDGFVSVECIPHPSGPEAARRAFDFLSRRYFYQR